MFHQFFGPVLAFGDQMFQEAEGQHLNGRDFGIERIIETAPVRGHDLLRMVDLAVAALADKDAGIDHRFFGERRNFVGFEFYAIFSAQFTVGAGTAHEVFRKTRDHILAMKSRFREMSLPLSDSNW